MANSTANRKIIVPVVEKPNVGMGIPLPDCNIKDEPIIKDEISNAMESLLIFISNLSVKLSNSFNSNSTPISPLLALRSISLAAWGRSLIKCCKSKRYYV